MLIPATSRTRVPDDGETTSFNRKTVDLMFALAISRRDRVRGLVVAAAVYLIPLIIRLRTRTKKNGARRVVSASIATGDRCVSRFSVRIRARGIRKISGWCEIYRKLDGFGAETKKNAANIGLAAIHVCFWNIAKCRTGSRRPAARVKGRLF